MRTVGLLLALVILAGCGGGGDDAGGTTTAAATTTTADPLLTAELLAAAKANQVDEARRLIEQGADVNARDDSAQSAFHYATSEVGPDPALLELMLAEGADVESLDGNESTGLIRASQRGYPELVAPLIEAGSEVDHVNSLGFTPLLVAVIFGDGTGPYLETVQLLLEAGADPTIPDTHGTKPIVHAELAGQTEVVEELRKAEAAR